MYYRLCPRCGASLDPCETCDCMNELSKYNDLVRGKEQLEFIFEKEKENSERVELCSRK